MKSIIFLCVCGLLWQLASSSQEPVGPIANFLRTNLIGHPVLHDQQNWIFDPDVALRRRRQFIELNGDKAENLIERLGLGIDGRVEERLQQQRQRDQGHLGGLNYFLP